MNKVWNMVQNIKGKNSKTNVHHLKDVQDTLTPEQDISNIFKKTLLPKITILNVKNLKSKKKKPN
jgi:hypothetical protein